MSSRSNDSPAIRSNRSRTIKRAAWSFAALLFAGPLMALAFGLASINRDWRTASQESVGLAPDPADTREAVVQVYAARTVGWRGAFAVHTWLATKARGASGYTRYEVIGWRLRDGGSGSSRPTAISISDYREPDGEWFGAKPQLLSDVRGADAAAIIDKLPQVLGAYPYGGTYRAWPGPNSNTFIAYLGRELPQLHLTVPSIAIGKDYQPIDHIVSTTPSHTGVQLSLYGLAGVIVGWDEGLELNVLGLVTGIDVRHPALKLPGLGRVPSG